MTPRERVTATLNHQSVDRAPREIWSLPGVHMYRKDELDAMLERFPADFAYPAYSYGPAKRASGVPFQIGSYTDAWGCVWHVGEPGVVGEVKDPPLADIEDIKSYELPWEILEEADLSQVNRCVAESDCFIKVGTDVRPFERLQFLRGTEALFMDLAFDEPAVRGLLMRLHGFYCRELEMWAKTDVEGVQFMDDWGSQIALLISPDMWRAWFKPLYREYCEILRGAGKYVFFHSDGEISSIYPDLIEIGIHAVNSQLFCMDMEELGRRYSGKITFWGEIDRQQILTFGTPDDCREAVARVRRALDRGKGGVIAQCEWGNDTPAENIAAVFEAWEQPL